MPMPLKKPPAAAVHPRRRAKPPAPAPAVDADADVGCATRGAAKALLAWYDRERRDLPWRAPPGVRADPYAVWLSEIMLQQTTVKAVVPYYSRFLANWPTVGALAAADLDHVLAAWAGLGYYARARNLHRCAQVVASAHGGRFPDTEAGLATLPGIGPYTAAAIAAIAFGRHATPVDGNIERVTARLFAVEQSMPKVKPELRRLAATLTPRRRTGDHAQALMDLGATVCTPRRPSCLVCPLSTRCRGREMGLAETLPRRLAKPERPQRYGVAFVVMREDGHVLLRRRADTGLLARMMEVPSTPWADQMPALEHALATAPIQADWRFAPEPVVHVFTHFRLDLRVCHAHVANGAEVTGADDRMHWRWVARGRLADEALPSVMRKVLAHAFHDSRGGRT